MNEPRSVRNWLERAGRIARISSALLGALEWAVIGMACWLALFALDNVLNLPAGIRLPLTLAGGALVLVGFLRKVAQPLLRRDSIERTAVSLEQSGKIGHNLLINACQLEPRTCRDAEREFVRQTLADALLVTAGIRLADLWRPHLLAKWGLAAAVMTVTWLLYASMFPRQLDNAFARYAMPLGDVPPAGSVAIILSPMHDLSLREGEDLAVTVVVEVVDRTTRRAVSAPMLAWKEGHEPVPPMQTGTETIALQQDSKTTGTYHYAFRALQRSFSFRVLAGDTYTRAVLVTVRPRPRIKTAAYVVQPPAYTGAQKQEADGPPKALACLAGSVVDVKLELDQAVASMVWRSGCGERRFHRDARGWTVQMVVTNAGAYEIVAHDQAQAASVVIASGEVVIDRDCAPTVDFVADNRNFFVVPGTKLPLEVKASDDYGVRRIGIVSRDTGEVDQGGGILRGMKQWDYLGPPGKQGAVVEKFQAETDAHAFQPGHAYMMEALCWDFRPGATPSRSRPIILRVKAIDEMKLAADDPLAKAFELLKRTIAEQRRANEFTENLKTHLDEALAKKSVATHQDGIRRQQGVAQGLGRNALAELDKHPPEGKLLKDRLNVLVAFEMELVLAAVGKLDCNSQELQAPLGKIAERQGYILKELIDLLGSVFHDRNDAAKIAQAAQAAKDSKEQQPGPVATDKAKGLAADLAAFIRAQQQILQKTESIMDKGPQDLTTDQDEALGELARAEAQWAKFLDEKLTDFSKLPQQDFADGTLAKQLNEVYQDVDKAAAALYEKKVEIAVPQEQSGLEKAKELENNIEKWLSNKPDNIKWSMEEPDKAADIPMAELPAELEDLVGDLIDKEEDMTKDVEDVSSSWMDSIDKGAGWDATDGPISDMSAKGVTGNMLPNNSEIGGRSGEGRSGKSNGQLVQDTAVGKEGRHTPTRVSPGPFESGSVKDTAKNDNGGATGGGKLSGGTEQGLHGPTPPPVPEKMARLSGEQAKIRQEAESMALKLRKYKLPSGDLETSIQAMGRLEEAAKKQDGLAVRQAFSRAVDGLEDARRAMQAEAGLHHERSQLPESVQRELMNGLQDSTPKGYEDMAADYFRQMAGGQK
ncbi:MAG: hypothetical protein ACOYOU_01620 [Kiritimatiellia bacterium]